MKKLNVYIYNQEDGCLIEALEYNQLILGLNKVIDNNVINNKKWNLICSESFPPDDSIYDTKDGTFLTLKEFNIKTKKSFINIIKHV